MRMKVVYALIVLAAAVGLSAVTVPSSTAVAADNTPGGAQVGSISSGNRSMPFGWNVAIDQTGSGPYTYTLRRRYDPDPILTTTGSGYFGSYTWYGDVWGTVTDQAGSQRVRLWDATAKPAVLLTDETLPCADGGPATEVSPNLRYVYLAAQCTVPGSGGSEVERFIRIFDLGRTAGGDPLIYSRTLTDLACCTGAGIVWSGDFDEVILQWGTLDAQQSRYAESIDLDTGSRHTWSTGPLNAPSGTTQWLQGFTPCGSSFVTYDTAYVGPTTTAVTYTLRATEDGAILGQVAMPQIALPPDSSFFPSLNGVAIAADGTVSGTYAGTTYTIGHDPTPCDEIAASPVPVWPVDPTGWHPYDFAGGRTLTWPAIATDDHAVTGYEVYAYQGTGDDWSRIATVTSGTSLVLPSQIPGQVETSFRVYALDGEGRRSIGVSGVPYYELLGTPGAGGATESPSPSATPSVTTSPSASATATASSTASAGPTRTTTATPTTSATPTLGVIAAGRVRVTGPARVGRTLTARPGRWHAGAATVRLRYRWYADGRAIRGATGRTLALTRAQRGQRITVAITGSATGYAPATATSRPTAKVKRAGR